MRTHYTLQEAADALGVSKRTLRRRIAEGKLPAALQQRGAQAVRMIQGADLARFAESEGLVLPVPDGVTPGGSDLGHGPATSDTLRVPAEDYIRLRERAAQAEEQVTAREAALRRMELELADVRQEREWLREQVQKLLPAAPAERPAPWWRRWFGGKS